MLKFNKKSILNSYLQIKNNQFNMSQRQRLSYGSSANSFIPTITISPSPRNPFKSPVSSSKKTNQPNSNHKQTVSYGQLQIVLENIQQIRKKANQQIQYIGTQNQQLRHQLKNKSNTIQALSSKLIETQQQVQGCQRQLQNNQSIIKEYQVKMGDQDRQIRQLQKQLYQVEERMKESQRQVDNCKKRWKWAFDILSEGQQHSEQFIWKVKAQYKNGLWVVLEQNKQLSSQLQVKNSKINDLQQKIIQIKDQNTIAGTLIQKNLAQVNYLKQQNYQFQQQLKKSDQFILQLQDKLHQTQSQLQSSKNRQQISQTILTTQKANLLQKIKDLQQQLSNKQQQMNSKQIKREYEQIIDEICDDGQNYDKLTQRIRYLQKFRNQYYFNVQKIQYLCKMLDQ